MTRRKAPSDQDLTLAECLGYNGRINGLRASDARNIFPGNRALILAWLRGWNAAKPISTKLWYANFYAYPNGSGFWGKPYKSRKRAENAERWCGWDGKRVAARAVVRLKR